MGDMDEQEKRGPTEFAGANETPCSKAEIEGTEKELDPKLSDTPSTAADDEDFQVSDWRFRGIADNPNSNTKLQNRDCSFEPLLTHKRRQAFPPMIHHLDPLFPTPDGPIVLAKRNRPRRLYRRLSKTCLRASTVQYPKAAMMGRIWKLGCLKCC